MKPLAFTAPKIWLCQSASRVQAEIARLSAVDIAAIASAAAAYETNSSIGDSIGLAIQGRVAVITVHGVMWWHDDFITDYFGIPTYESIARQFRTALKDSAVDGIAFHLDTPGGEAAGINELAEIVYQARLEGSKPIYAYVAGDACSAGYWLASACNAVIIDDIGMAGSVGTIATYIDDTKWMEQRGLREITIVSDQSPLKDTDPATDDGYARFKATLTDMAAVFVRATARNRGVTEEVVLSSFGQGWIKVGQDAVSAGLADRLGSFESVLAELAPRGRMPALRSGAKHSSIGGNMEITREYLITNHAELVESFRQEGAAAAAPAATNAGATAERERILAVEALTVAGHEDLIAECKKDPTVTAAIAAVRVVQATQAEGKKALAALKGDEKELEAPDADKNGEKDGTSRAEKVAAVMNAGRKPAKK